MKWIEMSQTNEVNVKGTAKTEPFVTAVIKDEIPYLQLKCRDEILRIHYDFKKNDVVKIDFEKEKVFINDELNMKTIDLLYADFFKLEPGINEIRTVPMMQLDIKYVERWI